MRIYISGPMSGMENLNRPAFGAAEEKILSMGHEPLNPFKIPENYNENDYRICMKNDIKELLKCDAIYLLRGWYLSRGANCEFEVARTIGLKVLMQDFYGLDSLQQN